MSTEDTSEQKHEAPASESEGAGGQTGLAGEIQGYVGRVDGIHSTLLFLMYAAQTARKQGLEEYQGLLDKYGTVIEESEGGKSYVIPAQHSQEVDKAQRQLQRLSTGIETLPKSLLVALVSGFDYFVGRVARWYLLSTPGILESSEKVIALAELLQFSSIEDAKEYFVEKEVETLLRKSHFEQFRWFEGKLGCTLREGLKIWPEFIEVTERRNLFAHTDGVVSRQYISTCREHGYVLSEDVKPGDELWVPQKYFNRAAAVLYQLGVQLGQTVWRRVRPTDLREADKSLVRITYELLTSDRFKLAGALLDFGVALPRFSDDEIRRTLIVNRAQSYKWRDRDEEARAILAEEDWSACAQSFQVCVAVLEDRFEDAAAVMKQIGVSETFPESAYITWPVFREFRKTEIFASTFREVFGKDPVEEVSPTRERSDGAADGETGVPSGTSGVQNGSIH